MTKLKENKSFLLLVFLAFFSFSMGLFSNYRELWMQDNGLSTITISKVITIASIITALTLIFFSLRVSTSKLRMGMLVSLVLKLISGTILVCLNDSHNYFLIKFVMFFDIAFTQIILSSIYPLIMSVEKNDEIYTKRDVVESVAEKVGFFIVSFLLGRTICHVFVSYNICLLLSLIFLFVSFVILLCFNDDVKGEDKPVYLDKAIKYFNKHKSIYLFLLMSFTAGITWSSITGLKMLTLTETIGLSTKWASFLVLILGIVTNILAMLVVKYFKFKNDYLNTFIKYGSRLIFYYLIFVTNSKTILLITLIYLLLSDVTYGFIFNAYFMNAIPSEYALILTVLKYCVNLIGNGLGTLLCGMTFHLEVKFIGLVALSFGIIAYVIANFLVACKRKNRELF